MSIFQQRFTTSQVIEATGITNASLQTWIRRDLIVGQDNGEVDTPGSPGVRRTFSFRAVLQIALGKALVELGFDASRALKAAARYCHTGTVERIPGLPFPDGVTLICVSADRSTIINGRTGNLYREIRFALAGAPTFSVVAVNDIFDRVSASLGVHPQAILDAAYGDTQASGGEA